MKQICIFCDKEFKRKDKLDNTRYGICTPCKISTLKVMKKKEYKLLIKDREDVKLVCEKVAEELRKQGYKEIE